MKPEDYRAVLRFTGAFVADTSFGILIYSVASELLSTVTSLGMAGLAIGFALSIHGSEGTQTPEERILAPENGGDQ